MPDEPEEDLNRLAESATQQQQWQLDAEAASDEPTAAPVSVPPADAAVPPSPKRIVEAFLFAGGPPLTAARATEAIRGLTLTQFQDVVASLNQEYRQQARPYTIVPREHGYVLILRPSFRP